MADSTNDVRSSRSIADVSRASMQNADPVNVPRYARGHLSRDFDDYNVHQQIQIEKETLKFLRKSKKFKRPPQSIRITGANVMEEAEKLELFSKFETTLLEHQIKKKEKQLAELKNKSENVPYLKLSSVDRKKLVRHYMKKLKFYAIQDDTKWKNWPKKLLTSNKVIDKKTRNFKKRQKRRARRTKRDSKEALESGSVVILVDEDVPDGAIALLGKGIGFVPTPEIDKSEERLHMRQTINRVFVESRKRCTEEYVIDSEAIPSQLRNVSYSLRTPAPDKQVNTIVERLVAAHDAALLHTREKKAQRSNLSKDESDGLKWIKEMTIKGKISVVQADKGGAILIVRPELLRKKVLEKLENPQLYTKLTNNPLNDLKKELFDLWKIGKMRKFVSEKMAYEVVGVTENNNMSTHPRFKPGESYFYPLLKIHKVPKVDLLPGVEPPARLVTSLRHGIAKRSDVFLADRFLKPLEKDYCKDLLRDTSDALRWLDTADREISSETKKTINCFTFDFKSLYDSLEPNLVKEAIKKAMDSCRSEWSTDLCNWILSLIDFSLRSSVAKYEGSWWKQNNGIPTGGSLCVQLANITVYYVMSTKVYNLPNMMVDMKSIKRYIDDGGGFHLGNEDQFKGWIDEVNRIIGVLGLHIDEWNYRRNSEFINLLDILYCFDVDGVLQTDLYIKETDSRAYLNFGSAHPNHTFSGNVYSQSLRLRRIINSDQRLQARLTELKDVFVRARYPSKMVTEITNKVQNSARNIAEQAKQEEDCDKILVVSTYGADQNIVDVVKESEKSFKQTQSFRNQHGTLFKFVKKVGPSLRTQTNNLKNQALGTMKGCAKQCNGRGCKTCSMLIKTPFVMIGNKKVKLMNGSCKTFNLCYLALCEICSKPYTGRTVTELHNRTSGHRSCYKEILKKSQENKLDDIDSSSDLYQLGLHLHLDHGFTDPNAFDRYMKFGILDIVNPKDIDKKEYKWMHKLNTFQPMGINTEYPFGIPLLGQN